MELSNDSILALVITGFVLAFLVAAGIGANDAVNSFGSLFGAKTLKTRNILILSIIFESLGAILIGMGATETIRNGIIDINDVERAYNLSSSCLTPFINEQQIIATASNVTAATLKCAKAVHLLGNISVLVSCAISLLVANFLKLPTSATHVVVGSIFGYGLIALRGQHIHWMVLVKIVSSWILSPIASGVFAAAVCYTLDILIGRNRSIKTSAWVITILYFVTLFLLLFSVFFQNSAFFLDKLNIRAYVLVLSCVFVSALVSILIRCILFPLLQKKNSHVKSVYFPLQRENNFVLISPESSNPKVPVEVIIPDKPECDKVTEKLLTLLQILTACNKSFAHGGNDVSNSIAPLMSIWLIYESGSLAVKAVPNIYLLAFGALGMSVGVLIWGTRVMETIGKNITEITPVSGFSIDFTSSTTVLLLTLAKIPISTTHCTVGSTVAVGWLRKGFKSVNTRLLVSILTCWVVSIPIPALLSMGVFWVARSIMFGIS